jgi:hypothetical protein
VNKRPLSVTIIAWIYVVAGMAGLAYHVTKFELASPLENDAAWVGSVRFLAVVAGSFMLRGQNWARWLSLAWMAWHVWLSLFHPWSELILHSVLLVAFAFFLFRPRSSAYFLNHKTGKPEQATQDRSML